MEQVSILPALTRFKMATRRNRLPLADIALTSQGAYQRVDLAQVGLLQNLWLHMTGSIAFGTGATGTISSFFPWNLLKSLVLRSNEGAEIYRTNGFTNLIVQMIGNPVWNPGRQERGVTGINLAYGHANTGAYALVDWNGLTPGTTVPTSGTYKIGVLYKIPVASDDRLTSGLLLLQNQSTRAQLEVQLGTIADWGITALGTGGAVGTFTIKTSMEFFSIPEDGSALPDLTFINRWVSEDVAWTATGDQLYRVPVNGVILRVLREYINNGSPQAFLSSADSPDLPYFGNVGVKYAGSQQPEIEDARIHVLRNMYNYGESLPDGVFCHEFSLGSGPYGGLDPRDAYDTSNLTEFLVQENCTATPTAAIIRSTRNELQPRAV